MRNATRRAEWARVALLASLVGCAATPAPQSTPPAASRLTHAPAGAGPWSSRGLMDDPDDFRFVVVSDRTGSRQPGVFGQAVDKTNLLRPELVMSVGDLIDGYTDDVREIRRQWDELEQLVERLEMRFYYVPGNHDLTNDVMRAEWKKRFGPSYYHFVHRNVLFLCLSTEEGAEARLGSEQVEYARRVLDDSADVRWTLVFMHQPLWKHEGTPGYAEFSRVEEKLQGRPYTVFAGHVHRYTKHVRHGQNYVVLGTTGGGSWLRGPLYGEFHHVVWVTMTDEGPRIANLMLDGIADEDVSTASDAERVDELLDKLSVRTRGTLVAGERFAGGPAIVEIENASSTDAEVSVAFSSTPTLQVAPPSVSARVAAGARAELPIQLSVRQPRSTREVQRVGASWTARADVNGKRFEHRERLELAVYRGRRLDERTAPVRVDGKLDEWGPLPHDGRKSIVHDPDQSWRGFRDLDYRFALSHDERYLYLAIDVTDDRVVAKRHAEPAARDAIEILIDPRDDPRRRDNRSVDDRGWRRLAHLSLSPAKRREEMAVADVTRAPDDVRFAAVLTNKGYAAEVAIPHHRLDAMRRGRPWRALRVNLVVSDVDDDSGKTASLSWQPAWQLEENRTGSGTFYRD